MSKVSYDKDLVLRAAAKRKLPLGWYRFLITEAKSVVSEKTNHLMTQIICAPLKDPDDANSKTSPTVRNNIVWPFANPEVEGHEPPNTGAMLPRTLQAILGPDVIPDMPVRGKDKVLRYRGEEIENSKEDEKRQEVITLTLDKGVEIHDAPETLLNETFYGKVKHDGDFAVIERMAFTLPDNAELVDIEAELNPKPKAKEPAKKAKK